MSGALRIPFLPFSWVALLANRRRLRSAHADARSPCRGRLCLIL